MRSVEQLMRLDDRVVIVTGGAGSIGRGVCDALAELGAAIVILDTAAELANEHAASLRSNHAVHAEAQATDVSNEDAVRDAIHAVVGSLGRLDVVVHLAALVGTSEGLPGWNVPFADQSSSTWRRAIDVDLTSAFLLAREAAPFLAQSGHGAIVNVASIYGVTGPDLRLYEGTEMGNPAAYAAAKGGLIQLTRWLATVLAPDVRVNAISPGGVARGQPAPFAERYVQRVPLGRMATEEDLKGAFVYLATDLSAYVTGQNLMVDGGWTTW